MKATVVIGNRLVSEFYRSHVIGRRKHSLQLLKQQPGGMLRHRGRASERFADYLPLPLSSPSADALSSRLYRDE